MASEVLIRFKTAALERASTYAKLINRSLRDALKSVQDRGLRGALRGAFKEEQKIEAQRIKTLSRIPTPTERLEAGGLGGPERPGIQNVRRGLKVSRSLIGALRGEEEAGAAVLQAVGNLGPVANVVSGLVKEAVDVLKKDLENQQKAFAAELESRLADRIAQADFLKKFDEDPDYAREVVKKAAAAMDAEEQRIGFVHEGGVPWLGR